MSNESPLIRVIEIRNKRGLHARASAKFVGVASQYEANILVSKDGTEVSGTSIMGLMLLAAAPGDHITVKVSGTQHAEALAAIEELVAKKFHEE